MPDPTRGQIGVPLARGQDAPRTLGRHALGVGKMFALRKSGGRLRPIWHVRGCVRILGAPSTSAALENPVSFLGIAIPKDNQTTLLQ